MIAYLKKILSHDCGPFWQFVKYGAIGVMATLVQTGVFYFLASTVFRCLTADHIQHIHQFKNFTHFELWLEHSYTNMYIVQ